ncbi:MAG: hypothetical protein J6S67_04120 [Methanobrevibacter sp.]|nr:hypothetical protein [Methanobrevibacter sp.]
MKGFDVLKVKSAVKTHNKFDLSRTHLTTMDFGEIVPMFVEETVPGDKFNIDAEYFSRMAPLAKPTYGKFSFKTCTAFVPYHQLAVDSDAWLAGKTAWEGSTPKFRHFTVNTLVDFAVEYCVDSATTTTAVTSADTYDITWTTTETQYYGKFSKRGKYWIKILNALGYALPSTMSTDADSYFYLHFGKTQLSAYPLLAFFKLYNDYMSQSQRFNSSILSSILRNVKYGLNQTGYTPATGEIIATMLHAMFANLYLNYENDYFTSAWQNPSNAINSIESITGVTVPGNVSTGVLQGYVSQSNEGDSHLVFSNNNLGQRALDFLKSFDDWVRRNNYSGSRAVQQIYSRFGIKTDDYKSHYANVLATDSIPVQVGDITSTADAGSAILGDYAGKGIMNGSKQVSCQVSDYGVILILGYFTVAPMNAYGFDRRVLRNKPLDYYNPEFDGLGADAISVGELWASPLAENEDGTQDTMNEAVFGFTERYNSYRYGRDVITGEFRDYHKDGDMNVWHTGRNLQELWADGSLVAQSTGMNTLPQTDSEYNRIFSDTSGEENHFYMTARFKVDAIRPMLNLNQVPRLGEGDTTVPRNGNVIS